MPVLDIAKDLERHTMTVTTELDAGIDRAWQLWADPRKLERWWGPPTYPATVIDHDLTPGGTVTYSMTGPEGDTSNGWWRIVDVDPPRRLELVDGFADEQHRPNPDLPTTEMIVTLEEIAGGRTRMTMASVFPSTEAMEQMISMGMEQGLQEAMGQIDAVLADDEVSAS
jgi:uncharacterized protein YndB with AHSA1/START domain